MNDEQTDALAEALYTAAAGNTEEADRLFAEWTRENRAINYIDEIQMYVIDHQNEMDIGNLFRTAMFMIVDSTHIECVKIGMELLELFTEPDESIKNVIRILGLCDEFTIFSVWNARKWKNGNEEVFRLAKGAEGWGRIHAVNHLKPESDEIRFWLLTEGTVNSVEYAYSALTCWEKAKAETILFAQPTIEEFKGISVLINALLDEGPAPGISEIGNVEDVLLRFLDLSKTFPLDIREIEHIRGIRNGLQTKDIQISFLHAMRSCTVRGASKSSKDPSMKEKGCSLRKNWAYPSSLSC